MCVCVCVCMDSTLAVIIANGTTTHTQTQQPCVHVKKMYAWQYHSVFTYTYSQHIVYLSQEKAAPQFVGYANLPNQVFRKAVKRGFDFTLMVVGKSTHHTHTHTHTQLIPL